MRVTIYIYFPYTQDTLMKIWNNNNKKLQEEMDCFEFKMFLQNNLKLIRENGEEILQHIYDFLNYWSSYLCFISQLT